MTVVCCGCCPCCKALIPMSAHPASVPQLKTTHNVAAPSILHTTLPCDAWARLRLKVSGCMLLPIYLCCCSTVALSKAYAKDFAVHLCRLCVGQLLRQVGGHVGHVGPHVQRQHGLLLQVLLQHRAVPLHEALQVGLPILQVELLVRLKAAPTQLADLQHNMSTMHMVQLGHQAQSIASQLH